MLELFFRRHSPVGLGMLFQNIPPAWRAKHNPDVFIFHSDAEVDAGLYAEQNERWVLESRASLLVEGFENPWQLGLPKHSPAALSVTILLISG